MGLFNWGKKDEVEETHHPVYEQPIVHREPQQYDHQAVPNAEQEALMLSYALGQSHEAIEIELSNQGWLNGRNGWVRVV